MRAPASIARGRKRSAAGWAAPGTRCRHASTPHYVGPFSQLGHVATHRRYIQDGDALIRVGMVAVGLIVGISQEAEALAVAGDDGAGVRFLGRTARAGRGDSMPRQPVERELYPWLL